MKSILIEQLAQVISTRLHFLMFFFLSISLAFTGTSQTSNEQILLEENGIKVTGRYKLISEGDKKDEYRITFNYQNISGFDLEYFVAKIQNEDGTFRLSTIGNNFLRLSMTNASGVNRLPVVVRGIKGVEKATESTQIFILEKGLSDSFSKTAKFKVGETPILKAKIVQVLKAKKGATDNNVSASSGEHKNDSQTDKPATSLSTGPSTSQNDNTPVIENYANGFASDVELTRVALLDSSELVHSFIFDQKRNRIIYSRSYYGRKEIVIKDLTTLEELHKIEGGRTVKAVSPDGNRIFYDTDIYDLKERKNYDIGVCFTKTHYGKRPKVAWIEDEKNHYLSKYN